MKNDEIRDRLATLKESVGLYKIAGRHTSANRLDEACGIIETLLARQDEALEWARGKHGVITASDEENGYFIAAKADIVYEQLRSILDPQEPDA